MFRTLLIYQIVFIYKFHIALNVFNELKVSLTKIFRISREKLTLSWAYKFAEIYCLSAVLWGLGFDISEVITPSSIISCAAFLYDVICLGDRKWCMASGVSGLLV